MKHETAYKQKKRKLNLFLLLMLLACFTALTFSTPQSLQASQSEENTQTQEEQTTAPSLLDVIKENQSEVDYIPFDFVLDELPFNYKIIKYKGCHALYTLPFRHVLTYERYRLISSVMDAALNATPGEFVDALNGSEELSVRGQALLMLALFLYEIEYRPSLFDSKTGERINLDNSCAPKRLSDADWRRYEEYLIDHLQSKEIVYELFVRNDNDREALKLQWNNSLRWNCANIIMMYPELCDESPLEAYALKKCQEGDVEDVRSLITSSIRRGLLPSGKERIYSNLGPAPKEFLRLTFDTELLDKNRANNSVDISGVEVDQDDSWAYAPSAVSKLTGDEAAKEIEYMKRFLEYLNYYVLENADVSTLTPYEQVTCELQLTLGEVAKWLLNARTRFQSREDFERLVLPLIPESE